MICATALSGCVHGAGSWMLDPIMVVAVGRPPDPRREDAALAHALCARCISVCGTVWHRTCIPIAEGATRRPTALLAHRDEGTPISGSGICGGTDCLQLRNIDVRRVDERTAGTLRGVGPSLAVQ